MCEGYISEYRALVGMLKFGFCEMLSLVELSPHEHKLICLVHSCCTFSQIVAQKGSQYDLSKQNILKVLIL